MSIAQPIQTLRWRPGTPPARLGEERLFTPLSEQDVQGFGGAVVWDSWPLLTCDGRLYRGEGGDQWWFALAARRRDDPELRHDEARMHLLRRTGDRFILLGPALPIPLSPGSREWSGSAEIDGDDLVLRFTAAGVRGERETGSEQRMFESSGRMTSEGPGEWTEPREMVAADGHIYARTAGGSAVPGKMKGFRDPEVFRDQGGRAWLLFTGSAAGSTNSYDGLIGLGLVEKGGTTLLPPLVDAVGCSRELERPHIRMFNGWLYLFWSTQSHVFAPEAAGWPTGLYGAVANRVEGPWTLLNQDGLIAANPPDQPDQAYSWLVLPDGSVTSFANQLAVNGKTRFMGGFAPFTHLQVDGARAWIEHDEISSGRR